MKRIGLAVLVLVLAVAALAAQRLHAARAVRETTTRVPILMYHKIGDGNGSVWWVPTEVFAAQMASLAEQGYQTVLPSDLLARHFSGTPLPPKPILLTFDDGYLNFMTEAEPILARHGFRAVNFLVTSLIGSNDATRATYEGAPCLTWPEVHAMLSRGTAVFGGHSRTHANLRALGARSLGEIEGCWDDLIDHGITRPEGFCFPFGQYREETIAALAQTPFRIGFSVIDEIAEIGGTNDLLTLPRVSVFGGARQFGVLGATNDATGLAVSFGMLYEGRTMPVTPRLVTAASGPDDGWLATRAMGTGIVELRWPGRVAAAESPALEVWDQHRVIRHFRASFEPVEAP